ncbi:MAG: hypothetical protein AAFR75_00065 [Pseudomonadota bacterium]
MNKFGQVLWLSYLPVLLILSGCSPEVAKQLEFGKPMASVVMRVELDTPVAPEDLLSGFSEDAAALGYKQVPSKREQRVDPVDGQSWAVDHLVSGEPYTRHSLTWRIDGVNLDGPKFNKLYIAADSQEESVTQFQVSMNLSSGSYSVEDGLRERHWSEAYWWYSQAIPNRYPDARIEFVVHPTQSTLPEVNSQLVASFSFPPHSDQ